MPPYGVTFKIRGQALKQKGRHVDDISSLVELSGKKIGNMTTFSV